MTETFCYHCRRYHPNHEMALIETRTGRRWRCVRSLSARRESIDQRNEFGRSVTASNQAGSWRQSAPSLPHCLKEIVRRIPISDDDFV